MTKGLSKQASKPSLKINLILNVLYEVLLIVAPLITTPYVSRVLRPEGIGVFSYTSSLVTYFTMVAVIGTANYGKREIARLRDDKTAYSRAFWEIELVKIITTVLCTVVWITFAFLYEKYSIYLLILSFTVIAQLFDISWFFGGLEKFKYSVVINSLVKIVTVVCIFVFVKSQNDLWLYILICSLGTLLGFVSMWVFLPKHICKEAINTKETLIHFKNSCIYFLPTIAISIYTVLDKTLIGLITNDESQNGYYEEATKIINLVKGVCFGAINGVMTARASYLYEKKDTAGWKRVTDVTYQLTTFLTVGACFGLAAISRIFVPIFFGEGYDPVVTLLYIMSPIALCICISNVAGMLFYTPTNKIKLGSVLLVTGSAINLILNLILIPRIYSYGAAIGSLVAEFIIAILFVIFTKGFITFKMMFACLWKKIIAGGLMFCCVFFLTPVINEHIGGIKLLIVDVAIGFVVYFLALILLGDNIINEGINFIKAKTKSGLPTIEFGDNFKKTEEVVSTLEYGNIISSPDFTLSIPIYGKGRFFQQTLKNVLSLDTFGLRVQVVISDNKDYANNYNDIIEVLKTIDCSNIAYFRCSPIGQLNNFNRCILLAKTEYVGLLHDDDLLSINYFEFVKHAIAYAKRKKHIGMIHQDQQLFSGELLENKPITNFKVRKRLKCQTTHQGYTGTALPTCGMIVNKLAFLETGGYNDKYFASGDAFLSIAMENKKWKILFSESILGYYRVGTNNSLKTDICVAFVKQDKLFRDYWASTSFYRRIHMCFFENYLYSKSLEGKVSTFGQFNEEIKIENLDYLQKYKKYKKLSPMSINFLIWNKLFGFLSRITTRNLF